MSLATSRPEFYVDRVIPQVLEERLVWIYPVEGKPFQVTMVREDLTPHRAEKDIR